MIKAEEISDIIKRQLQGYEAEIDLKEAGRAASRVRYPSPPIARSTSS